MLYYLDKKLILKQEIGLKLYIFFINKETFFIYYLLKKQCIIKFHNIINIDILVNTIIDIKLGICLLDVFNKFIYQMLD